MPTAASFSPSRWLLALTSLPTEDPAARMRVLRTLDALGCAAIREGAYLLPDTPANAQAFNKLAEYVAKSAGLAHVLHVVSGSPEQDATFRKLFDRTARYDALAKAIDGLRVGYGISETSSIRRVLAKQRREFENLSALDFFPDEARARAEAALGAAEDALQEPAAAIDAASANPLNSASLQGRTWISRTPPWADRLASAWLVRRFVDHDAVIGWLDAGGELPEGAIGFAFKGAQFAGNATQVAFETMVERLRLGQHAPLARIGAIVRYLEVGGAEAPEAAGVETLLRGAMRRAQSLEELLAETEKTFDLLYEAYVGAKPA